MAVFDVRDTLTNLHGVLASSGHYVATGIGEPASPPQNDGITARVWLIGSAVALATLSETIEVHRVNIRLYSSMFQEEQEEIVEVDIANATSQLMRDLAGDFNIRDTVGWIDVAGMYFNGLSSEWGHVELGGIMFRVVDMQVPFVVTSNAVFAA
jgi:hypothetical protein